VGVFGDKQAARLTYYGLHALQHRGQEASGIVACERIDNGKRASKLRMSKGRGLVTEVFSDEMYLRNY